MLIPQNLLPYFTAADEKKGGPSIVEGRISCCGAEALEIYCAGALEKGPFGHAVLCGGESGLFLAARCPQCGGGIAVFDSLYDGYDRRAPDAGPDLEAEPDAQVERFSCRRCAGGLFYVKLALEYPPEEELRALGFGEPGDAFTWIRVELTCARCGRRYRNFIDYETA